MENDVSPPGLPIAPGSGRAEALRSRTAEMAQAVLRRALVEIPAYRSLPAAVLEGDLIANANRVFELFVDTVAQGRMPTEDELALPISWGAERARDGLPIDAVLTIYVLGAQEAWRIFAATETPVDPELDRLVGAMLRFLTAVMPPVAAAHLRERDDLDWEQRERRQNLAGNLLAGRLGQRAADRHGRTLAARYDVVVFRLPAVPVDTSTRATTEAFRAVLAELDRQSGVLTTFRGDDCVALVPTAEPDRRARIEALLAGIDEATGMTCTLAAAGAGNHAAIPTAVAEATEVLALVEQLGRPPGAYWLADVAIEYQLAQPSPARTELARIISPLVEHPQLVEVLRAFIATDFSRGQAAAALGIHRNTLTYRLGRVLHLTGYDATQPADARKLAAALTAHDIELGVHQV